MAPKTQNKPQAPATEPSANVEPSTPENKPTETTAPATEAQPVPTPAANKRKQADHGYVGADGQAVDDQEKATGCTYKDVKSGQTVTYQIPAATAGAVGTMLAVFGLKTLFTNTASANRQNGSPVNDIAAINARMGELKDGQWAAPSDGTPRGPKIDLDIVAGILAEKALAAGKPERDVVYYMEKLTDDAGYRKNVMAVPEIKAEYNIRAKVAAPTLDDLL